jgi:hypothetical protein
MDPLSRWINLGFMIVGSALGMGTSWYLYKVTMRFVEEAERERELGLVGEEGVDGEGLDLEAGLLGEVDALLDEEESAAVCDDRRFLRREGKLVDVQEEDEEDEAEEDRWSRGDGGGFSDFDESESKAKEGALVNLGDGDEDNADAASASGGTTGARRDSEAWGLDFDDDEADELDPVPVVVEPVKKRID